MRPLLVSPEHDAAVRAHGRRAFPHECCGFMLGRLHDHAAHVHAVLPADNIRGHDEQHNRFTISPRDFMRADKAARAQGLDIVGFYHSHPDHPARPSAYDLEHAWPVYSYAIVSVLAGRDDLLTSWVLKEDRSAFDEQPVQLSP